MSSAKRTEIAGARAQVTKLFALASTVHDQGLANRYVTLARKIASKSRISLRAYNRMHCRKCSTFFTTQTLRVRTHSLHAVYTCLSCGHMTRVPMRQKGN